MITLFRNYWQLFKLRWEKEPSDFLKEFLVRGEKRIAWVELQDRLQRYREWREAKRVEIDMEYAQQFLGRSPINK